MLLTLTIAIIIELLLLFLISRAIIKLLYLFIFLPTKHQTTSNHFIALLFLPGTVIHEFSHAAVAKLLRVPVGKITLYPHKDELSGEIKAGSVEIGKKDIFRLALIGIAPLIVGMSLLTLLVYSLYSFSFPPLPLDSSTAALAKVEALAKWDLSLTALVAPYNNPQTPLIILGLFMLSTTMFTSRKDLREVVIVLPILIALGIILYLIGIRLSISITMHQYLTQLLYPLAFSLGITIFVDLLILVFLYTPLLLILKLFHKKLYHS